MQMLKVGKFAALALAVSLVVGCSSKGSDASGQAVDPNAGYNAANAGAGVDGSMSAEQIAALRAIKVFYFDFDSSDLKPEAMRALDVHAADLKASGAHVVLQGNTDDRGTREYNMALGERRGEAVKRYLVLQGVPASQIEVVSYGEERPVDPANNEQAWALNRRVELVD